MVLVYSGNQSWANEPLSWGYLCIQARGGRALSCGTARLRENGPTITLLPVGCGGWSLLLGDLWSGVESRQYQLLVHSVLKHLWLGSNLNWVFKALYESWSRWPLNYKTHRSRICGCNLTFDPLKIKQPRPSEGSNQTIKHAPHQSKFWSPSQTLQPVT